jgi:hypothetical protein
MWKIVLGFVVFAALSLFVIFKSCDSFKLFGNSLTKQSCRKQQQSRF